MLTVTENKVCCRCQQEKPACEFYKRARAKDGLTPHCKDCNRPEGVEKRIISIADTPERCCSTCKAVKPRTDFNKSSDTIGGYSRICKACISARNEAYRRTKQHLNIAAKQCAGCGNVKGAGEFYKNLLRTDGLSRKCKACTVGEFKDWLRNNPKGQEQSRQRTWRKKSEADRLELNEARKRTQRKYKAGLKTRLQNPEFRNLHNAKASVYLQRRRARKANSGGSHTLTEWQELCTKFNNRCLSCGRQAKLTKDHVIPLVKGGTDNIDNLQPLCLDCNLSKGIKTTDYRVKQ